MTLDCSLQLYLSVSSLVTFHRTTWNGKVLLQKNKKLLLKLLSSQMEVKLKANCLLKWLNCHIKAFPAVLPALNVNSIAFLQRDRKKHNESTIAKK